MRKSFSYGNFCEIDLRKLFSIAEYNKITLSDYLAEFIYLKFPESIDWRGGKVYLVNIQKHPKTFAERITKPKGYVFSSSINHIEVKIHNVDNSSFEDLYWYEIEEIDNEHCSKNEVPTS